MIGTDYTDSCNSNYHAITTTSAPDLKLYRHVGTNKLNIDKIRWGKYKWGCCKVWSYTDSAECKRCRLWCKWTEIWSPSAGGLITAEIITADIFQPTSQPKQMNDVTVHGKSLVWNCFYRFVCFKKSRWSHERLTNELICFYHVSCVGAWGGVGKVICSYFEIMGALQNYVLSPPSSWNTKFKAINACFEDKWPIFFWIVSCKSLPPPLSGQHLTRPHFQVRPQEFPLHFPIPLYASACGVSLTKLELLLSLNSAHVVIRFVDIF